MIEDDYSIPASVSYERQGAGYDPDARGYELQGRDLAPAPSSDMERLLKILALPNIVKKLSVEKLSALGQKVVEEYEIDETSRNKWIEDNAEAMKLAMLVSETKDYPFPGAANVKYPLLAVAALQFNARAYPAVVPPDRVAKCKTYGQDPNGEKAARAERVSEHLSYQLTHEIPEWDEDTDRLLMILPISASVFRKTYYDPSLKRTCSRLVTADRMVVNYGARSLAETPRLTEKMDLYPHEIEERIRSGRFVKFDYKSLVGTDGEAVESSDHNENPQTDDDAPQLFLEQHRLYDLDEDGYPEPYICTVHKATQKVVRIVANFAEKTISVGDDGKITSIRRKEYYSHYRFLPSPDGGFYGMGFGTLLKALGESINTTLNQMLDAGHLANIQGGLISSVLGIREKNIKLVMGEFRVVNTALPLNQAVMPITYPGPSTVLFQLLGLLVEAGKEIAAIKDVLTGEGIGKNASPTTTLAMIEQGLQVFTAIYKRIHRSLSHELSLHVECNREHLTPEVYSRFFDAMSVDQNTQQPMPQMFDPQADYDDADMDIMPFSDPAAVSKMQKLAKADFLYQTAKESGGIVNPQAALKRVFEAADIEKPEELITPPQEPDPEQMALLKRGAEAEVAEKEGKAAKAFAEADKAKAETDSAGQAEQPEQPSDADMMMKQMDVRMKELDLQRAELDVMVRKAEMAEKDVEVSEDGDEVKSRMQMGMMAIMDGLNMLAQLVAQQGQAQTEGLQTLAAVVAAPNELVRDEAGRAVGSRKVLN
ncbi:MAG: hypothetical protein NUV34_08555 [Sulfuricaulis sp.]|nr:hypothetical protein [Sulfuricaulis sp.]